jgi:hypothetical protein
MRTIFPAILLLLSSTAFGSGATMTFQGYGEATRDKNTCIWARTRIFVSLFKECEKAGFDHCKCTLKKTIEKRDGFCRVYMEITGAND